MGAGKLDVERTQLDCPLSHPTIGLAVLEDTLQGIGGDHPDGVRLKVVAQLSRRDEDRVEHLLYHRVPGLGVTEYFTDLVHRALDSWPGGHMPTPGPTFIG